MEAPSPTIPGAADIVLQVSKVNDEPWKILNPGTEYFETLTLKNKTKQNNFKL